jgi:two-component system OmpR family response regulator
MLNEPPDLSPIQVLLIDPDPACGRILAATLSRWGHLVTLGDPEALGNRMLTARAELVLLDPTCWHGGRGWLALRGLREHSRLPVMVMLAGDDTLDRVLALESGADAIIAKPVDVRELHARLLGLRAREAEASAPVTSSALSFGRWRLDPVTRRLNGPGGFSTPLSPAEFRLLRAFLERPQSVLRRQELMDLARDSSGAGGVESLERSIDLLISRLRHKLNDDARNPSLIRTVRGVGYLFDDSMVR